MISKGKVRNRISNGLEGRISGDVCFIKDTINTRSWFFIGVNYIIREGEIDREVYIALNDGELEVVGGVIKPDDVLIPQHPENLFIFTPALEVGKITVEELINEVVDCIDNSRDIVLANILKETSKIAETKGEFNRLFRSKLRMVGEVTLSSQPIDKLFMYIVKILDINEKEGFMTKVESKINGSDYEIIFYEDREEVMRHSFKLDISGLYGFGNYLNIMSQTVVYKEVDSDIMLS